MKFTRLSKKILSIALTVTMLLSVCAPTITVMAESAESNNGNPKKLNYVSLGASNTNGYGHLGYLPGDVSEDPLAASKAEMNVYGYKMAPENAYPALIQKALQDTLGVPVELNQLAISSMRVEEMRVLLDNDYYGDAYTEWRFTGGQNWFGIAHDDGIDGLRKEYQTYVKNADLITVDMGWNNFGVYAFNNIKTILSDGVYWKAPDFAQLDGLADKLQYEKIKSIALEYLKSNADFTDEALNQKIEMMADVLAYSALGACYHFDKSMEIIYDLNPDVQVVVINIQNLADDLVVEFMGEELELGDLYGEMIALVDEYRRGLSPYADQYMFAHAGDIETFLDEIVAWDGNPETLGRDMRDCFDMYDDNLYVRSIVEYLLVGQALSGVFAGFRDMGAGYGLEVFKDDAAYTYDFALTRTPEQLLSLNLSKLDLNNPAGSDKDVEEYGKALSKHLYNLRHFNDDVDPLTEGDQLGKDAYNYVFEELTTALKA